MVRGKIKLKNTAKASTILEVVVSMVIIMLVFGTAMVIYSNVLRLSLSVKQLKAQALLQQTLLKAEQLNTNTNGQVMTSGFKIDQQVKPFENEPQLNIITLTAYDNNEQPIATLTKVITSHDQ